MKLQTKKKFAHLMIMVLFSVIAAVVALPGPSYSAPIEGVVELGQLTWSPYVPNEIVAKQNCSLYVKYFSPWNDGINWIMEYDGNLNFLSVAYNTRESLMMGIGAAADGTLYLGLNADKSISIYKDRVKIGYLGIGANEVANVNDITIDTETGDIYVVDNLWNEVKGYHPDGEQFFSVSDPIYPQSVDIWNGEIYVLDNLRIAYPNGSKVLVYDRTGRLLRSFIDESIYNGGHTYMPRDIALDNSGNIYIASSSIYNVPVFDNSGGYLGEIGLPGIARELAISPDQRLFVNVSIGSAAIYMYGLPNFADYDLDNDLYSGMCQNDCNDEDPLINPGATEVCDGVDNNCDGVIDEGFDVDGDGFTSCGGDCNDNDPTIYPDAPEVKHDGIDQDCNGYDLTIDITKANYSSADDSLRVEATSSLGASASLELSGHGPMIWKSNQQRWEISVEPVGGNPGTVEVCGIEGCESAQTTVD